jgi:hypothetical protein
VVARLGAMSANPVLALRSGLRGGTLNPAPYNADIHRQAVGAGVMIALIVFSFFCLVFLLR